MHFDKELQQQPYQDEVHFWLAQAHWRLGHVEQTRQHLRLAAEHSVTNSSHGRYTAKLALLQAAAQVH
jgi:thioredoxin-like negative regulator of GroEL